MKRINFSSRIPEKMKSKNEDISRLGEGITKALLEKYKPKALHNIETIGEKKVQRRVA